MLDRKFQRVMCALALTGALGWGGFPVHADGHRDDSKGRRDDDRDVKTVFVIAMENHNWVQPSDEWRGWIQEDLFGGRSRRLYP